MSIYRRRTYTDIFDTRYVAKTNDPDHYYWQEDRTLFDHCLISLLGISGFISFMESLPENMTQRDLFFASQRMHGRNQVTRVITAVLEA